MRLMRFYSTLALMVALLAAGSCKRTNLVVRRVSSADLTVQTPLGHERPAVTVWIHGTTFIHVQSHNFYFCTPGLWAAKELDPEQEKLTYVARELNAAAPEQFPFEHFYLFGWSGNLSFTDRAQEGQRLYDALSGLVERYQHEYGVMPAITLITHSHGGNVALNLVRAKKENCPFVIDKLVLLGCPVQEATKRAIHNPFFKKTYSFYGMIDQIQWLDPQGLQQHDGDHKKLFSERLFEPGSSLCQVKIKKKSRGLLHLDFIRTWFLHALPGLLELAATLPEAKPGEELLVCID